MLEPIGLSVGKPGKVADAIVAVGTARVRPFSIIVPPGATKVVLYQNGATVLSGNIEFAVNSDLSTWQVLQAFDLIANKLITLDVIPGIVYRMNVAVLTTTPADIVGTID